MTVEVDQLVKRFRVHQREPGLRSSLRGVFRRTYLDVNAVSGISFDIPAGQIVGFIGPNGAGKTTTLKCLSGLLYPTSGEVRVLGHRPFERKREFLESITFVLGQRSSLLWDLPAGDAFAVNRAIYGIDIDDFRIRLDELVDLLGLEPLLTKQVRTLSLGERMRCELAGALLHQPKVLFLDEPTLGLDVNGQLAIRSFLHTYNERYGATVLLTSHYMGDVTALAKRVIVIDHGSLRFDGDLQELIESHSPDRLVRLTLRSPADRSQLARYGSVESVDGAVATLRVSRDRTTEVVRRLLDDLDVNDVAIDDPPIEEIIGAVFAGE